MMTKLPPFLFLGIVACTAGLSGQAQHMAPAKATKAQTITVPMIDKSIATIGGKATVAKYFCAQDPATDDFRAFDKIATGAKEWVDIAVKVLPYSDAACSQSLHSYLGEAMQKQPRNVLPYVGTSPRLTPEYICLPFISIDIPESEQLQQVRRSKAALLTVKDKALSQQCRACLTRVTVLEKKILADVASKKRK